MKEITLKKVILISSIILAVVLLGYGVNDFFVAQGIRRDNAKLKKELQKREKSIDSLNLVILNIDKETELIKDSIKVLEIVTVKEIEKLKVIPIDSTVSYLREKLKEYEDKY